MAIKELEPSEAWECCCGHFTPTCHLFYQKMQDVLLQDLNEECWGCGHQVAKSSKLVLGRWTVETHWYKPNKCKLLYFTKENS